MSRSLSRISSSTTQCIQSKASCSVLASPAVSRRRLHAFAEASSYNNVHRSSHPSLLPPVRQSHGAAALKPREGESDEAHAHETEVEELPALAETTEQASSPKPFRQQSRISPIASDSRFSRHLEDVFGLSFPPDMARRMLTHASHVKALTDGHNARLGFIGRRALQTYLTLFLAQSPATLPEHDYENITTRALNTYAIGQHVAPQWKLSRVVRWTPVWNADIQKYKPETGAHFGRHTDKEMMVALSENPQLLHSVGLYKVMGEAVQAVVGGIYHQHGAAKAHQIFHTKILPHLLIPGALGLHQAYHADAFNKAHSLKASEVKLREQQQAIGGA